MTKSVLITGASGFIGGALLKSYTAGLGSNVEIIAMVHDYHRADVTKVSADHIVIGDITDYNFLCRVISEYEINTIFHLASQAIVRSCANDPMSAYETNVMGMVKLLEAVRTVGMNTVKSIVVSTSDKAFGHAPPPYDEHTPLMPKYTYEATKTCQDIVAQNYFHNYGVPTKICRCSNVYGPGDPNESRIIPNTIKRIRSGNKPVIYSDVAEYVREFIFIDDVVSAFKIVDEKAAPGEIFCVGGTEALKVKDLVQRILDLSGSELEVEYITKTASVFKEIDTQYINADKLKALGWSPAYGIDEGIKETLRYYSKE